MDSDKKILDVPNARRQSISHHDLRVSDWTISARLVEVTESPPNPVLEVDFSKFQATAERPLILTEDHILVDDPDTRDADDNVDASKIKFRITNIAHGTLHERADTGTSTPWTKIVADGSNAYLEFTLAQLQGGLIAFFPDKGASTLTFKIQADDGTHLSDSDRSTSDSDRSTPTPDPESVSVPVVVLKKVVVGEEVRINDDGVLTPNDDTLDEWLAADDTLRIFVVLQGGKSGIFTPSGGVVHEHLSVGSSHGVASSKIAVSWDGGRLSLTGTDTATRVDFQKVLGTLQLQTVPFGQVSHRTILVQPDTSDMLVPVARAGYYLRGVEVSASAPNPILELDFDKSRLDSGERLVLTQEHILVYDPDTHDADGNVDPSRISFRITGLTGGELQRLSSSSASDWTKIVAVPPKTYLEFTLADLKAGKIAFLAGDGLASGKGKKIVFQVQAADAPDNNANLSDSDPNDGESDADPVDAEIPIVSRAKATAGYRGSLNADRTLTPDAATLDAWKQSASAHGGTLRLIVRLLDSQTGDVLSLRSGYDTSKVTPRWNGSTGELALEIGGGTTVTNIQEALELLEFDSALSSSASTRKVWVFPVLSGVRSFGYRVDETAGLVRYYLYDSQDRSFSAASRAASGRTLFGKRGYLGVPLSSTAKDIYRNLKVQAKKSFMHVAISDSITEGKWLMTDGPRKGQLFWDYTASKYGPGAEGSGWTLQRHFWSRSNLDGGSSQNYAMIGIYGGVSDEHGNRNMSSISHHDLWLEEFGSFVRFVDVAESPPNPVLRFDSNKFQVTSQSPLILTEDHISLEDVDTRDSLDPMKVDGSRITFRVRGISGAKLQHLFEGNWRDIPSRNQTQEFTLRQLREGLVSLLPDDGVSTLTFRIQAADDGDGTPGSLPHLSDSDPYDDQDDADPTSVSLRVVALKEIYAGKEMPVNDDRRTTGGDGALTPGDAILHAWMGTATGNLRVLVGLEGGRRGDTLFVESGHGIDTITSSWSWDADTGIGTLSLRGKRSATVDNFQAILNALALRTVRSASATYRTISIRPDIAEEVPQKDYYARDVLVRESGPRPYVGEQKTTFLQFGQDDRAILLPSLFLVEDFDTSASNVTIVVRKSTSAATLPTLQRNDGTGKYTSITPESDDSLEFTLEDLQQGLIAVYLSSPAGKKVEFDLEAKDDDGKWNDIGKSNAYQKGARSFSLYGIQEPAPEDLEVDLQTGYQKALPFKGLEEVIETARSDSSGDGALHIVLKNGVSGDRLVMRKSVSGITGGLEPSRTSLYAHGVRQGHHE